MSICVELYVLKIQNLPADAVCVECKTEKRSGYLRTVQVHLNYHNIGTWIICKHCFTVGIRNKQ